MKMTLLTERPSAFTAACAPAHASGVGSPVVAGVPAVYRMRITQHPVAFNQLSARFQLAQRKESVQLNDALVRMIRIEGRTAKATGMAQASGVPPRGRPV
jgi:hypothetical protein